MKNDLEPTIHPSAWFNLFAVMLLVCVLGNTFELVLNSRGLVWEGKNIQMVILSGSIFKSPRTRYGRDFVLSIRFGIGFSPYVQCLQGC